MLLVIDNRERAVIQHTAELGVHECRQLTVGDYAIIHGQLLMAVIERKTLEDYAASFKDGRHHNRQKMLDMREKYGCRVYYIIEGQPHPPPDKFFGGIQYSKIQSSIDHLQFRDGIYVIYTKDTLHTAKRLAQLVESITTLTPEDMPTAPVPPDIIAGGEPIVDLTAKQEKSPLDICRRQWACFRGITPDTADTYIKKWQLADIICQRVERQEISTTRHSTGRLISKSVVSSLSAVDRPTECKLLASVPGISVKTAGLLLGTYTLRQLIESPPEVLAAIEIGKRKLGLARANALIDCFTFSQRPAATN